MPQWVRCASGQCTYPSPMCTPAYQERFGKYEKQTETPERVQLPLKAAAKIFNRKQERIFTFSFQSFPTLSDIKLKIQEKLGIRCDDLLLYEFDDNRGYSGSLYWGKLEVLPSNYKTIGTVMKFILIIRGNVTNDLVKRFTFETLDEIEIPVFGSKTHVKVL